MKEYIERQALLVAFSNMEYPFTDTDDMYDIARTAPAADVVEVVHGRWREYWDDAYLTYSHKCSLCGELALTKEETMHDEVLSKYCPHCGAKMDGGNNG